MSTPRKREQQFLTDLRSSVNELLPGSWWYKIPDAPRLSKQHEAALHRFKLQNPFRFIPGKPFDALMVYRGRSFAFEAKAWDNTRAWPITSVSERQVDALTDFQLGGGESFVLLFVSTDRHPRAAMIPMRNFCAYLRKSGRRSWPVEDVLMRYALGRRRGADGPVWSIDHALGYNEQLSLVEGQG